MEYKYVDTLQGVAGCDSIIGVVYNQRLQWTACDSIVVKTSLFI